MKIKSLIVLVLSYSIFTLSEACGPGRGGGRRRMLRKYPPLIQRQYIPNVSENTMGASERPEGPIRRRDKRFKELVQNNNPDIEFRDDERTGADRMMSQRLKEKLSILAISVMNQWPNVKLRVIEGWDEDNKHSLNSLHYEGRAVDITTSDRDRAKYGMLARLAVEAGFDWVHYESRSHVHCSVKSEKADTIRNNGCFDSNSLVETPDGSMEMSQLQTNDLVMTMNSRTGQFQFSPIIMWLDRDEQSQELFVELQTKSDRLIRLTLSHLIYVADEPFDLTPQQQKQPQPPQKANIGSAPLPNTGNHDNNQQNNYYYQTNQGLTSTIGERDQALTNVPNTNNVDYQVPNVHYNLASTETPSLTVEDITYTTYARNAIVGQYLLVNSPVQDQNETQDTKLLYQLNREGAAGERSLGRIVFKEMEDVQRAAEQPTTKLWFDQIVSVNYVTKKGIYAPLTREGNIVVNSVVASCYAVISDHELAHLSFAPVRWFSYINEWLFGLKSQTPTSYRLVDAISDDESLSRSETQDTQDRFDLASNDSKVDADSQNIVPEKREIHWYPLMLYRIAKFILPTRYLY